MIHIVALSTLAIQVYLFCQAQLRLLLANKALIKVLSKYLDYDNIFSFDYTIELYENISINEYAIKLVKDKQLPYWLIYSLKLVKLKTLKTYIETYLKSRFIQPSKFLTGIPIFFNQKLNKNLCLCINYQGLNNLTIKN